MNQCLVPVPAVNTRCFSASHHVTPGHLNTCYTHMCLWGQGWALLVNGTIPVLILAGVIQEDFPEQACLRWSVEGEISWSGRGRMGGGTG